MKIKVKIKLLTNVLAMSIREYARARGGFKAKTKMHNQGKNNLHAT